MSGLAADDDGPPLARVAIVGRPNVGKSTLFNRLAGRRLALVDDTPGVTRDRRDAVVQLGDLHFRLTDTAGFEAADGDDLAARIQAQTDRAIAEADAILFVFDARAGLSPLEHALAQRLRRAQLPVVLVANKCEGRSGDLLAAEGHALGLGSPLPVSAEHGDGLGLLYDALAPLLAAPPEPMAEGDGATAEDGGVTAAEPGPAAERVLQLAVVGRPNVGKSTLINRLIGDERLVTGPEAGITRDAIGLDWTWQGRRLRLFDTAGLRKRAKVDDKLEALAGADTQRAIRFANVVILVIDATTGLERQDISIADAAVEEGRAPLLAINKWDLVEDRSRTLAGIRERIDSSLPQVRGLRFVTLSAATGEGMARLLPAVVDVYSAWGRTVPTARLNRFLQDVNHRQPPPSIDGRPLRARYITQAKARPPSFVLFVNRPDALPDAWLRFLANALRDRFGFDGVPLRVSVRRTRNPYARDGTS